jgi:zinc protease
MDILGSRESLESVTRNDIVDCYDTFCIPSNMVISMAGDLETEKAIKDLKEAFGKFRTVRMPKPPTHMKVESLNSHKNISVNMDKKESLVLLAYIGASINSRDRYTLNALSSIMSGHSGRLFHKVRDAVGLSYTQHFFSQIAYDPGKLGIYVATSPKNIEEVRNMLFEEIEILTKKGVSEDEVNTAKTHLIARRRQSMQVNSFLSMQAALHELYGNGFESIFDYEKYINDLTVDDINEAIVKYIARSRYALVTIIPGKSGEQQ